MPAYTKFYILNYQNIDLKFKDASEEEIREEIARGNLQIEENNNEIEKLKETIKTKQPWWPAASVWGSITPITLWLRKEETDGQSHFMDE